MYELLPPTQPIHKLNNANVSFSTSTHMLPSRISSHTTKNKCKYQRFVKQFRHGGNFCTGSKAGPQIVCMETVMKETCKELFGYTPQEHETPHFFISP